MIISYADPEHNHTGGIYQAMNWVYIGQSTRTKKWKLPSGKILHDRVASPTNNNKKHFGKASKRYDMRGAKVILSLPKFKYIYPLDEKAKKKAELLRKPYPKCVDVVKNSKPEYHSGSGGESPTSTLQPKSVV